MRALSVRQPWAWAIARGHKAILNRGRDTGFRGLVAVHSSLRIDLEASDSRLIRAVHWDPGDPAATIGGIVALPWPVLTIGQPGLWELAPRVEADVTRLLPGPRSGITRPRGSAASLPRPGDQAR